MCTQSEIIKIEICYGLLKMHYDTRLNAIYEANMSDNYAPHTNEDKERIKAKTTDGNLETIGAIMMEIEENREKPSIDALAKIPAWSGVHENANSIIAHIGNASS